MGSTCRPHLSAASEQCLKLASYAGFSRGSRRDAMGKFLQRVPSALIILGKRSGLSLQCNQHFQGRRIPWDFTK